jgi:hypothetical protein
MQDARLQAEAESSEMADGETVGVQGGRFGIGFASSHPAYGISGTLQMSETLTAQAILGVFSFWNVISGRIWFRFNRNETYDIYGYGAAGIIGYRGYSDSNLLIGFGGGVEVSAPALFEDEDFPPIFANAEIGFNIGCNTNRFNAYSGCSGLSFGTGIHYRFGDD